VVEFKKSDSYQGMPFRRATTCKGCPAFSGCEARRQEPAAKAVWYLSYIGGIAEAKPGYKSFLKLHLYRHIAGLAI
jgi:hypothetical protein